jgi:dimethylargininase
MQLVMFRNVKNVACHMRNGFGTASAPKAPTMNVNHFQKKIALTRDIDESLVKAALTMQPGSQQTVDLELARKQHTKLCRELKWAGLEVHTLPSAGFADSVFIEDTAVVVGRTVVLTNPGARSRRGEVMGVRKYLRDHFTQQDLSWEDTIDIVEMPDNGGTVDGGDILFTGTAPFEVSRSCMSHI